MLKDSGFPAVLYELEAETHPQSKSNIVDREVAGLLGVECPVGISVKCGVGIGLDILHGAVDKPVIAECPGNTGGEQQGGRAVDHHEPVPLGPAPIRMSPVGRFVEIAVEETEPDPGIRGKGGFIAIPADEGESRTCENHIAIGFLDTVISVHRQGSGEQPVKGELDAEIVQEIIGRKDLVRRITLLLVQAIDRPEIGSAPVRPALVTRIGIRQRPVREARSELQFAMDIGIKERTFGVVFCIGRRLFGHRKLVILQSFAGCCRVLGKAMRDHGKDCQEAHGKKPTSYCCHAHTVFLKIFSCLQHYVPNSSEGCGRSPCWPEGRRAAI